MIIEERWAKDLSKEKAVREQMGMLCIRVKIDD
jgi:hypothetical protein